MSLLGGVLTLHDPSCPAKRGGRCAERGCIADVERLCGSVLERKGIKHGDGDYEDLLAWLISESWRASTKPERDGGGASMRDERGTGRNGSSRTTSTSGPSRSSSVSRTSGDALTTLSERSQAILRQIEVPLTLLSYSTEEIADRLSTTSSWVNARRAELRNELERGRR